MSLKREIVTGGRFLEEALPLVATYFSGESVTLAGKHLRFGRELDGDALLFASQIRLRHALACCAEIILIIHRIEERPSSANQTIRTETRGVIRGRLDIPRYVAQKAFSLSWPKTYPILVSEDSASTPENLLAVRVLRHLLARLSYADLPKKKAESTAARWYRRWISHRLRREPWTGVSGTSSLSRLKMETTRRVARRQTGNDRAYAELVSFIDKWQLTYNDLGGSASSADICSAILAFPFDESFNDRIYEIWCIREIAACFCEIGASISEGPISMLESGNRPIYTFSLGLDVIEIWFQLPLPSQSAEWKYETTDKSLRGIPDISILVNGSDRMLVDAKNRLVTGNTRSEETYKMLGYFENFRATMSQVSSWGVLAFTSYQDFQNSLTSRGRRLELLSANPDSRASCSFRVRLKAILVEWLAVRANR